MRRTIAIMILLITAFAVSGCDSGKYQMVTGSDGALYRFNKKTGELSMIMDNKKAVPAKAEEPAALDRPINWKESRFPGKDLKARLETIWRENKLCYKFTVYPSKSLERIFARKNKDYTYTIVKPGFNIELIDRNGFMVKEVKIILWSMAKAADNQGKEKELVVNSQIDCSKQSYASIGGYTIKWLLDANLIDDEKEDFIKSTSVKGEDR